VLVAGVVHEPAAVLAFELARAAHETRKVSHVLFRGLVVDALGAIADGSEGRIEERDLDALAEAVAFPRSMPSPLKPPRGNAARQTRMAAA
jgi:hypothetical protein